MNERGCRTEAAGNPKRNLPAICGATAARCASAINWVAAQGAHRLKYVSRGTALRPTTRAHSCGSGGGRGPAGPETSGNRCDRRRGCGHCRARGLGRGAAPRASAEATFHGREAAGPWRRKRFHLSPGASHGSRGLPPRAAVPGRRLSAFGWKDALRMARHDASTPGSVARWPAALFSASGRTSARAEAGMGEGRSRHRRPRPQPAARPTTADHRAPPRAAPPGQPGWPPLVDLRRRDPRHPVMPFRVGGSVRRCRSGCVRGWLGRQEPGPLGTSPHWRDDRIARRRQRGP